MTRTECDNMFHDNMYAMCEVESRADAEREACQVHYLHINDRILAWLISQFIVNSQQTADFI